MFNNPHIFFYIDININTDIYELRYVERNTYTNVFKILYVQLDEST